MRRSTFSSAAEYSFLPSPSWRSIVQAEATSSAEQQRVWFGLGRVVHLAVLLLFSATRKENFRLTKTTEDPLDSGKRLAVYCRHRVGHLRCANLCFSKGKSSLAKEGCSGGVFWFGWQLSRFFTVAPGSTFYTSLYANHTWIKDLRDCFSVTIPTIKCPFYLRQN